MREKERKLCVCVICMLDAASSIELRVNRRKLSATFTANVVCRELTHKLSLVSLPQCDQAEALEPDTASSEVCVCLLLLAK